MNLPSRKTFSRLSERGWIEVFDAQTFELLELRSPHKRPGEIQESKLVSTTLPDGRIILVDSGLTDPALHLGYQVSETLVDLICQQITEGKSLTKICKSPGFPPYFILVRWQREHQWIREALEQARRDRAEVLRDELLEIVDNADENSDAIAKAKLRAETRKWAAGVDDQTRYGKNDKAGANVGALQIIVSTGIMRPGDPGFRQVEEIKDGKNNSGSSALIERDSIDGGNPGTA